jgi:hypothetical protein
MGKPVDRTSNSPLPSESLIDVSDDKPSNESTQVAACVEKANCRSIRVTEISVPDVKRLETSNQTTVVYNNVKTKLG